MERWARLRNRGAPPGAALFEGEMAADLCAPPPLPLPPFGPPGPPRAEGGVVSQPAALPPPPPPPQVGGGDGGLGRFPRHRHGSCRRAAPSAMPPPPGPCPAPPLFLRRRPCPSSAPVHRCSTPPPPPALTTSIPHRPVPWYTHPLPPPPPHTHNAPQVCLWFDSTDYSAAQTGTRKFLITCFNLVITFPLQLLLHFVFARTASSWVIPGIEDRPVPEPPDWYQRLVCLRRPRTARPGAAWHRGPRSKALQPLSVTPQGVGGGGRSFEPPKGGGRGSGKGALVTGHDF